MKKIISILVVCLLIYSCNKINEVDTVINVVEFKKGRYEVSTYKYLFYTNTRYSVGDTIVLCKK